MPSVSVLSHCSHSSATQSHPAGALSCAVVMATMPWYLTQYTLQENTEFMTAQIIYDSLFLNHHKLRIIYDDQVSTVVAYPYLHRLTQAVVAKS
jgi:hypothetical protein